MASTASQILAAISPDEPEVVTMACIRSLSGLAYADGLIDDQQTPALTAILNYAQRYIQSKTREQLEESGDVLATLATAFSRLIARSYRCRRDGDSFWPTDPSIISTKHSTLPTLLQLAEIGASTSGVRSDVKQSFKHILEEISREDYGLIIEQIRPLLIKELDSANIHRRNPALTVLLELLETLIFADGRNYHNSTYMFAETCLESVKGIVMSSTIDDVLENTANCLKYILIYDGHYAARAVEDHHTVLDTCVTILRRILEPNYELCQRVSRPSSCRGACGECGPSGYIRERESTAYLAFVVEDNPAMYCDNRMENCTMQLLVGLLLIAAGDAVDIWSKVGMGDKTALQMIPWLRVSLA
jgi:hypothetical protein